MPSSDAIYLHDTPNHNLFQKDVRVLQQHIGQLRGFIDPDAAGTERTDILLTVSYTHLAGLLCHWRLRFPARDQRP